MSKVRTFEQFRSNFRLKFLSEIRTILFGFFRNPNDFQPNDFGLSEIQTQHSTVRVITFTGTHLYSRAPKSGQKLAPRSDRAKKQNVQKRDTFVPFLDALTKLDCFG